MAATRKFPRWLKWIGILLGLIVLLLVVLFFAFNESKPTGKTGPEAEALAAKMLQAIDKNGWDTTEVIRWNFAGRNTYLWDRKRHFTEVISGKDRVLLNINAMTGKAWKDGTEVTGEEAKGLIQTAWSNWCNDSFWLNAPAKIMDAGTTRSLVTLKDGREGLLVTYESGGVTPGDSYLWILDEKGIPTSYKMWVKIIPIGGMEFTWENWLTLPTGAKIAQTHKGPKFEIPVSEVKGASTLGAFGFTEDPFAAIAE